MLTLSEQANSALVEFETARDEYNCDRIDATAIGIRGLYKDAGQTVVAGDPVDQRINEAVIRAYGISAEKMLARFEDAMMDYTGDIDYTSEWIDYWAEMIRDRFRLAGQPVGADSLVDRRIMEAVLNICSLADLPVEDIKKIVEAEKLRGIEGAHAKKNIAWLDTLYGLADNRPKRPEPPEPPTGISLRGYLEFLYGPKAPGAMPG